MGLGFVNYTPYLFPLTLFFLIVGVAVLGFRAGRRRGYGPLALGLTAAPIVLAGKFWFESNPAMFSGIALLLLASLWNAWPKRRTRTSPACPDCGATDRELTR